MCEWMFVSIYQPCHELATSDKNITSNPGGGNDDQNSWHTDQSIHDLFKTILLPVQSNVLQEFCVTVTKMNPEICISV